jgi:hypothetical protein
MYGAELIEKEQIRELKFVNHEVLGSADAIVHRKNELERAALIGNAHQGKIKIIFETQQGLKEVETTVWSATEKYITLKGELTIPVNAIKEVIIY